MVKGEGLQVLRERMKALDPDQNEIYKFLGCEQGETIDVRKIMERVKKEIQRRMDQLVKLELYDSNLIKAINCRVIPVAAYVMNVCNLRKHEIEELDKIVKRTLRREGYHGRQACDERLYMKRELGGRGLKSFKDVYKETKVRVACYIAMTTSTNEWIRAVWENEVRKEHTSLKKEAKETMQSVGEKVQFGEGFIEWQTVRYVNWKEVWKKLKKRLQEAAHNARVESLQAKRLQGEIFRGQGKEDYVWLRCNTDPRKTGAIFSLQEQMVETKAWKKLRGLVVENEQCRICKTQRETVHHILAGCTKLAGSEYVRRHDKALMVLAVEWAIQERLLPNGTRWYKEKWEKGKVIEKNGRKICWDFEYRMRMECTARRPDLTLESEEAKQIFLVDMACPMEANIAEKKVEKKRKYQQLAYEIRERRQGYRVEILPIVIGSLGGGMEMVKNEVGKIFHGKVRTDGVCREMQKIVLWESESILRKVLSGLIQDE